MNIRSINRFLIYTGAQICTFSLAGLKEEMFQAPLWSFTWVIFIIGLIGSLFTLWRSFIDSSVKNGNGAAPK